MFRKTSIEPVSPELIDADPSVKYSFQADGDFKKIHATSAKAKRTYKIAPDCVASASQLASAAGLPPVERLVASAPKSRLMIFSLEAEKASPPGPRVFGLMTEPTVKLDEAISFVQPLL